MCKCTPIGRARVNFLLGGGDLEVEVVYLVVLACILRATTKKVVNVFEKKVHPIENPGYAYDYESDAGGWI